MILLEGNRQTRCNRVFETAARNRSRLITVSAVEQAAAELVQDNEHFSHVP